MSVHLVGARPGRRRYDEDDCDLTELTYRSVLRYRVLPAICALVFLTVAPWIHIGCSIHLAPKPDVDKSKCKCHCFDTVFRGHYEWAPAGYKPVYFNAVPETLKILILSLIYVIITYEIIRHVVLCYMTSSLRVRMLFPVLTYVFPVYYSWWSFFNYINERFHVYYYHDAFFALTEIVSLLYFVHFCDRKRQINATKILIPMTLNLTHVLVGGLDQFVENLFFGKGERYERTRNLGLLFPDMLIVCGCIYELTRLSKKHKIPVNQMFYKEEVAIALVFILLSTIVLSTIVSQ